MSDVQSIAREVVKVVPRNGVFVLYIEGQEVGTVKGRTLAEAERVAVTWVGRLLAAGLSAARSEIVESREDPYP